jgi:hypothetical protein
VGKTDISKEAIMDDRTRLFMLNQIGINIVFQECLLELAQRVSGATEMKDFQAKLGEASKLNHELLEFYRSVTPKGLIDS